MTKTFIDTNVLTNLFEMQPVIKESLQDKYKKADRTDVVKRKTQTKYIMTFVQMFTHLNLNTTTKNRIKQPGT